MFIEDIIADKNKYYEVEIEGFENYFEVRQLTRREDKELNKLQLQGSEKVDLRELGDDKEDKGDEEVSIKIDMAQLGINNYETSAFIIKNAFRSSKTEKGRKTRLSDSVIECLSDEQMKLFVDVYNKQFDKEDRESFPDEQEES